MKFILTILFSCITFVALAEEKSYEIGVVDYLQKYEYPNEKRHERSMKSFKLFTKSIEKITGETLEKVDVDFFLEANRGELTRYKRIIIPPTAAWFTAEMYQGMNEYVRNGGLLISFEALILLDKDGSYEATGGAHTKVPRRTFLGTRVFGGGVISKFKASEESPISTGISSSEWTELKAKVYGKCIRKMTANTALIEEIKYKNKAFVCPVVTYKTSGKGSCIYIAFNYSPKVAILTKIMQNILSAETLNWLCAK